MGIEQFGESLLTKQRERIKKQERRDRRADLIGAAASIGIGVYRNNLKKKQEEFFKSAPVLNQKILYGAAEADANEAIDIQAKINSSPYAEADYFERKAYEAQKNIFASERPDLKRGLDLGAHEAQLRAASREIGNKQLEAHRDRYNRAIAFKNSGSFQDSLDLVNNRPKNVFQALLNRKSDKELTDEAIQEWKKGTVATTAVDLDKLSEAYDKTKNLSVSFEYAQAVKKLTPLQQEPFITRESLAPVEKTMPLRNSSGEIIPGSAGEKGILRQTKITNEYTGTTSLEENFVSYTTAEDSMKDVEKKAARARTKTYNIHAKAEQTLSKSGQQKWATALDENGISEADRLDPPTLAIYTKMAEIYADIQWTKAEVAQGIKENVFKTTLSRIALTPIKETALISHIAERDRVVTAAKKNNTTFEQEAIRLNFDQDDWNKEFAILSTQDTSSLAGTLTELDTSDLNSPYFK